MYASMYEIEINEKNSPDTNHQINTSSSNVVGQSSKSRSARAVHSTRNFVTTLLPILSWVSRYPFKKYFLYGDLWAGAYIGLYEVAQCVAYSFIASYPTGYAFHTTIVASILYTFLGTHRRLSYGVFSLVSALYIGVILERVHINSNLPKTNVDQLGLITMVTFLIGVFSIIGGFLRIGSLVRFIPYEVMSGLRAGLYLLIFVLQLNSILGIDANKATNWHNGTQLISIGHQMYQQAKSHVNWYSVGFSAGCLGILSLFRLVHYYWDTITRNRLGIIKQLIRRIPVEFILIAISFTLAYKIDIGKYELHLVGSTNTNVSTNASSSFNSLIDFQKLHFEWPDFNKYFHLVWSECITATILYLVYTHSLAVNFNLVDTEPKPMRIWKRQLDPKEVKYVRLGWKQYSSNHELISSGLINGFIAFLHCLPCGASGTRSTRQRSVGGRSQIAGLVSGLILFVVWYTLHTYLAYTPQCIIASIVAFDSLLALKQEVVQLKHFWTVSSLDLLVWLLTVCTFIFLDLELAFYLSLSLALLVYVLRTGHFAAFHFQAQRTVVANGNSTLLVPEVLLPGSSKDDHKDNLITYIPASQLDQIQIYKLDQRYLTVSNMDNFIRDVFRKMSISMKTDTASRLIFDCRGLTYLDWPSIRLVKATVMRAIEVSDSWRSNESSPFTMSDLEHGKEGRDDAVIEVVFVFTTKMVQMIHNAGVFNVNYYHSLHRALHIGLKSAINAVMSHHEIDADTTSNGHGHFGNSSIVDKAPEKIDKIEDKADDKELYAISRKKDAKEQNRVDKELKRLEKEQKKAEEKKQKKEAKLSRKEARTVAESCEIRLSPVQSHSNSRVLPISFKQNSGDEFSESNSSCTSWKDNSPKLSSADRVSIFSESDNHNRAGSDSSGSTRSQLSTVHEMSKVGLEYYISQPSTSTALPSPPVLKVVNTQPMVPSPLTLPSPPPPPPPPPPSSSSSNTQTKPSVKSIRFETGFPSTKLEPVETKEPSFREKLEGLLGGRNASVKSDATESKVSPDTVLDV